MTSEVAQLAQAATATPTEERLTRSQKMAVSRTARAFQSYGEAKAAMASIAKSIVSLRLTFEKDGRPDYRGETPQYRGAIAALYEAAIPNVEERSSFKVAIRYWVGKEYADRVASGKLQRAALEDAGIVGRGNGNDGDSGSSGSTGTQREPRRALTAADMAATGIIVDGEELTPPEVLVEAERMVTEHVASDALGPVMALQSIARELGPVVAALRNPEIRDKQPGRALATATEQLLILTLDAAHLSGVEVEEFVAGWYSQVLDTEHAVTNGGAGAVAEVEAEAAAA